MIEMCPQAAWPAKFNLLGVDVSAVTYESACELILDAAEQGRPAAVTAFSVHALIGAARDPALTQAVNRFAIVTPDGQPVRWALNGFYRTHLTSNVRGSELMRQLCQRAAERGVSVYLYGAAPETLQLLEQRLREVWPSLKIAGAESPPFRPLSADEDAALIERVNSSGAGLFFVGLGAPKQDYFIADHADTIRPVQLSVGAAFDMLAGVKPMAPEWMQRNGLEWIYRFAQEPRRLWRRYVTTNTLFITWLAAQFVRQRLFRRKSNAPVDVVPASDGASTAEDSAMPISQRRFDLSVMESPTS